MSRTPQATSLQDFKPLQQLSEHELANTLPYGGPFLLSREASMLDLCECMKARLRALDAVLYRMGMARDADAADRAIVEAAEVLLLQATAAAAALQAGVLSFDHAENGIPWKDAAPRPHQGD